MRDLKANNNNKMAVETSESKVALNEMVNGRPQDGTGYLKNCMLVSKVEFVKRLDSERGSATQ